MAPVVPTTSTLSLFRRQCPNTTTTTTTLVDSSYPILIKNNNHTHHTTLSHILGFVVVVDVVISHFIKTTLVSSLLHSVEWQGIHLYYGWERIRFPRFELLWNKSPRGWISECDR